MAGFALTPEALTIKHYKLRSDLKDLESHISMFDQQHQMNQGGIRRNRSYGKTPEEEAAELRSEDSRYEVEFQNIRSQLINLYREVLIENGGKLDQHTLTNMNQMKAADARPWVSRIQEEAKKLVP